MSDLNLLENLEEKTSAKKIYPNALYINTGPLSQDTVEIWIRNVIDRLKNEYPHHFDNDIWFQVLVTPISLINLPKRKKYKSEIELPAEQYIPERAEIETSKILDNEYPIYTINNEGIKVLNKENKENFHDNEGKRNMLKNEIQGELDLSVKSAIFSSQNKLNSGYTYFLTNSKRLVDVMRGCDLDGNKNYNREFKEKDMTEEDVIEYRKQKYEEMQIIEFKTINVDYCKITFEQLHIVMNSILELPVKKALIYSKEKLLDINNSINWYLKFFEEIFIFITERISGNIIPNDYEDSDLIRVGYKNTKMTTKQRNILFDTINFIEQYNISNLTYSLEENDEVNIKSFMDIVKKYVTAININLVNQSEFKLFDNITNDPEIIEIIRDMISPIEETFKFDKKLFQNFKLYETESSTSYINRIQNVHFSGLNQSEIDFIGSALKYYEDRSNPFPKLEYKYIFNVETFVNTISRIINKQINMYESSIIKLREEIAIKLSDEIDAKDDIEKEIDIKFGPIVGINSIKIPKPEYGNIEREWVQSSINLIYNKISNIINSKRKYSENEIKLIFNELNDIIVKRKLDEIPDSSFLSYYYTGNEEIFKSIDKIDDLTFINIKNQFDLYLEFIRDDFFPTIEDFVFVSKEGLGLDMKFKLTDKCIIFNGSRTMIADIFYEPQQKSANNKPNYSVPREIRVGGGAIIANYFRPMFEKYVSVNPIGFNIIVKQEEEEIEDKPSRINIVMTVQFPIQEDVYIASKFKTSFISSDISTIIRIENLRDAYEIDKKYLINWYKVGSQQEILAGVKNAKTLKMYESSLAMILQYPFWDGRFPSKLAMIIRNFKAKNRTRVIRTQDEAKAEYEKRRAYGMLGSRTNVQGEEIQFKDVTVNKDSSNHWSKIRGDIGEFKSIVRREKLENEDTEVKTVEKPMRRENRQTRDTDSQNSSHKSSHKSVSYGNKNFPEQEKSNRLYRKDNYFNSLSKTKASQDARIIDANIAVLNTEIIDSNNNKGFMPVNHKGRIYNKNNVTKSNSSRPNTPAKFRDNYNPDDERDLDSNPRSKKNDTPKSNTQSQKKNDTPKSMKKDHKNGNERPNSPAQIYLDRDNRSPSRPSTPHSDYDDFEMTDASDLRPINNIAAMQNEFNNMKVKEDIIIYDSDVEVQTEGF